MQNKQGVSLIVLVITIIVMIILAASVVITLSNTGVINRASQAADLTNESQVQDLAALVWADAYMDGKRGSELETEVTTKLSEQGITANKWNITVSDTGVSVTNKSSAPGLGSLISKDNYGDTVDYTVIVDGITYDEWQIYYHNSDYVYLICKTSAGNSGVFRNVSVDSLTEAEKELYAKFQVGNWPKYTLKDKVEGITNSNSQAVAQLIKDYAIFANTTETYKKYVEGAIGGPTIELLASGWNASNNSPKLTLALTEYGYMINDGGETVVSGDGFYVSTLREDDYSYWIASPSMSGSIDEGKIISAGYGKIYNASPFSELSLPVRPVVCLKASIPATTGTGDYDFNLTK